MAFEPMTQYHGVAGTNAAEQDRGDMPSFLGSSEQPLQSSASPAVVVVVVSPGSTATAPSSRLSNQEIRKALLQAAASLGTETVGSSSKHQFGRILVDSVAHRAWVDDSELALPRLEFRLLSYFCEHGEAVHTRIQLLRAVWGVGEQLTTRTVDNQVNRLRIKLGTAGSQIQTVRGVGYRFVPGAS